MIRIFSALFISLICFATPHLTFAHKASDSYLQLQVHEKSIQVQWDIALRDLDIIMTLDNNLDEQITWQEVRTKQPAITQYALSHLQINANTRQCKNSTPQHLINQHSDGAYAVLKFTYKCPDVIHTLDIEYNLLFNLDALHRGLINIQHHQNTYTGIFSPVQKQINFDLSSYSAWSEWAQYVQEGIWHIWIGFDHILFLICLLLPTVLIWQKNSWQVHPSFKQAMWCVFKIVTAFTVAHSITLSLAVLGHINLPSRWVESAIAASVIIAALHNLHPVMHKHLWIMTFIFGLVHGFGFASVLSDLGLPAQSKALALAGFNIGVEIGQLVIVATLIPLIFLIRHYQVYQRVVLNFGSIAIALLATAWLLERSMNIHLRLPI